MATNCVVLLIALWTVVGALPELDYQGSCANTASGRKCQKWASQAPHKHQYTGPENYCRDPDHSGFLWCYTTDKDRRWEKCNVDNCPGSMAVSVVEYKGTCDNTASGRTCQRWASQAPHKHQYTGPENYCRDPDHSGFLWCYTTDKDRRWEKCSVDNSPFRAPPLTVPSVSHYQGNCGNTATGRKCQRWDAQTPHEHQYTGPENYCRDPDHTGFLWCYTTDKDRRWEMCNVNNCPILLFAPYYQGSCANTASGRKCQKWASQSPHKHQYTGPENYCRDPDHSGFLWCYTTDKDRRWEKCNVDNCPIIPHAPHYTGICASTASGRTCQRWDSQSPYHHSNNNPHQFPDANLEDASNYCRDPDNAGFLWCYTTAKSRRWEKCNVYNCPVSISVPYYKGTCGNTATGRTCQRWDKQEPHEHQYTGPENYCRDPDHSGFLWCYTTDKGRRWEKCSVDNCPIQGDLEEKRMPDTREEEKRAPAGEKMSDATDEEKRGPPRERLSESTDEEKRGPARERLSESTDEEKRGPAREQLSDATDEKRGNRHHDNLSDVTDEEKRTPAPENLAKRKILKQLLEKLLETH